MSEFLIDEDNCLVWYDLKSHKIDPSLKIIQYVKPNPQKLGFYVRLHREDGPAFINEKGSEFYYISGCCHREDGPAIIFKDESIKFYLNHKKYSFSDWCKKLNKSEEEINFLKLKYNI